MRRTISVGTMGIIAVVSGVGCLLPFDDGLGNGGECMWDDDCSQPSAPCQLALCRAGECTIDLHDGPWPGGTVDGCTRQECVAGQLTGVPDASLADDGNPCTEDLCRPDGTTEHPPLAVGTRCGGDHDYCDAAGVCQRCPDDGDGCTVEDCSSGALVVTTLDPGASCGGDGYVCDPDASCFLCDDFDSCTTETCDDGLLEPTPRPPGSGCDEEEDGFCTLLGACASCDDGDPCTHQDCSTGEVVVTGPVPPGSECGPGDVCSPTGACVECDDGNPCTQDLCDGGVVTHELEPHGASCSDDGADGFCDAGVCVTWCLPLPDASCADVGPGEPANDTFSGAVAFATDESAEFPICGRLATSDAVDWYAYPADDDSFRYDSHRMRFWSYGEVLRTCSYARCAEGETEILSCTTGSTPVTGPEGEPGCCWEQVFRDEWLVMDVECISVEDSPLVRMRVESPGGDACVPYALRGFSY